MAAILCSTVGDFCEDCCHCLTLPCRACCDLVCSPFIPYIGVTLILNIPLVVWGLQPFMEDAVACDKVWWLWGNAIMAGIHIVASFYISNQIQNEKDTHLPTHQQQYATATANTHANAYSPVIVSTSAVPVNTPTTMPLTGLQTTSVSTAATTDPYATKMAMSPTGTTQPSGNAFLDMYNKVSSAAKSDASLNANGSTTKVAPTFAQVPQAQYVQPTKVETLTTPTTVTPYTKHSDFLDDDDDRGAAMSWQRLSRVLCYDAGVAIYIVVVVAWVIWQTVGVTSVIALAGASDEDDSACGEVKKWIVLSTMCGWIYMMVVFCAFGCSLICLR